MICLACTRALHDECEYEPCCCTVSKTTEDRQKALISEAVDAWGITTEQEESETPNPVGRPRKPDDEIGTSAGRKRAAEEYPLYTEQPCEWRWLANCGGGKHPVVGCLDGKQVNRHHGPVKNTSNNSQLNVHRICSPCHNTWHAKNDEDYDEEANKLLPHNPRPMTPEEMLSTR